MKTCRGSRNRAGILREHRLIAFAIRGFVCARYVPRERHVAEALQVFVQGLLVMSNEPQRAQAELPSRSYFGLQLSFAKKNALTKVHFAARTNQRFPAVLFDSARQQNFDF